MGDPTAIPLSFLNKVFLSPQSRYYSLDMIAAAAAAAVEWYRSFEFELRSLDHLNFNVFILSYLELFLLNSILKFYLNFYQSNILPISNEELFGGISSGV